MTHHLTTHRTERRHRRMVAPVAFAAVLASLGATAVASASADDGVEHPCATRPGEIALCQ